MVSFAGDFKNPTEGWEVHQATDENGRDYAYVAIPQFCECGHSCCARPRMGWRPHTNGTRWYVDEHGDDYGEAEQEALDWMEALTERWEEQYDQYLEENGPALAQMERYEMWRREY